MAPSTKELHAVWLTHISRVSVVITLLLLAKDDDLHNKDIDRSMLLAAETIKE